jgi:predicted ATPase
LLKKLSISSFKSIRSVDLNFASFTVFFGPNSAGKSNILDCIQVLSRLATERTIDDALTGPVRGNPVEVFSFPGGGLQELLDRNAAQFSLDAVIDRFERTKQPYRYKVSIQVEPRTGKLSVAEEHLETLNRQANSTKGQPRIRVEGGKLVIPSGQGRPKHEPLFQNHTKISDERYSGSQYHAIEQCRRELAGWEIYYFDPRDAMRRSTPPSQVSSIGPQGEHLAAFLYRLKNEEPFRFSALQRTLHSVIPSISGIDVVIDERRGMLDVMVTQGGVDYSARVMSEGTLRVLALCAIALNPWGGSLIAIEEPENGVQPQRIELIAELLLSMSSERRQIIVTSHSPIFCAAVVRSARNSRHGLQLFGVIGDKTGTITKDVDLNGPLFEKGAISDLLRSADDDECVIDSLMSRGGLNAL